MVLTIQWNKKYISLDFLRSTRHVVAAEGRYTEQRRLALDGGESPPRKKVVLDRRLNRLVSRGNPEDDDANPAILKYTLACG